MGLLDKFKRKAESILSESRLEEELMYKHILEEMEANIVREGLYAKALANSDGDESKAKALYMKYRVQSIKDTLDGQSYLEFWENQQKQLNQKKEKLIKQKQSRETAIKNARKFRNR
jgi:hypothetical protein